MSIDFLSAELDNFSDEKIEKLEEKSIQRTKNKESIVKEISEAEKIERGQRGKKKCPICIALKPVRLNICDVCGFNFKKKNEEEIEKEEKKEIIDINFENAVKITKIPFIRGVFVINLSPRDLGKKLTVNLNAKNLNYSRPEIFTLNLRNQDDTIYYTQLYRLYQIEISEDTISEEDLDKFLRQNFNLGLQPEYVVKMIKDYFKTSDIEWKWLEEENKIVSFKSPVASRTIVRKKSGIY